jgi:UDP-glucose 4-epimerase
VTAATGVLGKEIVTAAVDAGLPVRQAVRNPANAIPNVEAVRLDYADPSTVTPALAGVSAIVLMTFEAFARSTAWN